MRQAGATVIPRRLDTAGRYWRDPAAVAERDALFSGPGRMSAFGAWLASIHPRPPVRRSQTGSQRRQASGHARRQPAMVGAASWPIRPHPATCSDTADAPEKRKAGGSTPPLTTSFAV